MSRDLTERDKEILGEYIDAGSVAAAARRLKCHPQTVKSHLANMRQRTNSVSTVQLVYRLATGEFDGDL
jgi:DNA-binding CsgD family transcriptional regulator